MCVKREKNRHTTSLAGVRWFCLGLLLSLRFFTFCVCVSFCVGAFFPPHAKSQYTHHRHSHRCIHRLSTLPKVLGTMAHFIFSPYAHALTAFHHHHHHPLLSLQSSLHHIYTHSTQPQPTLHTHINPWTTRRGRLTQSGSN